MSLEIKKEKAKHYSDILKAFSEGKAIQYKYISSSPTQWWDMADVYDKDTLVFDRDCIYRIKPEPTLRPYKNAEEFLQAEKLHGPRIVTPHGLTHIAVVEGDCFLWNMPINDEIKPLYYPFSDLLIYKWADGTPCGVEEIEEL